MLPSAQLELLSRTSKTADISARGEKWANGRDSTYIQDHCTIGANQPLLQLLFPRPTSPREEATKPRPILDEILTRHVESPTASDRIRAWRLAPELAGGVWNSNDDRTSPDSSAEGLSNIKVARKPLARKYALSLDASLGSADDAVLAQDGQLPVRFSTAPAAVPFRFKVQETERRFEEQMAVHRGLNAALRQVELVEKSAELLASKQRIRAILLAMRQRQEAVDEQVWGAAPPLDVSMPPPPLAQRETPPPQAAAAPKSVSLKSAMSTPISSVNPLLKGILDTFSKPRNQRGGSEEAGSTISSSKGPLAAGAQRGQQEAKKQRIPAVEYWKAPEIPQPYTRVRYVAVEEPVRMLPKGRSSTASASVIPEEVYSSDFSDGSVVDMVSDNAASTVDMTDQDIASIASDSAISTAVSSALSSIASDVAATTATEDAITESIDDDYSDDRVESSISEAASIISDEVRDTGSTSISDDFDGRSDGGRRHADGRTLSKFTYSPSSLGEVLEAFYAACRSATEVGRELLDGGRASKRSAHRAKHRHSGDTSAVSVGTALVDSMTKEELTQHRSDLQRQLRNVRRLKRFKNHLEAHLHSMDVERRVRREQKRLLKQTQSLSKTRQRMLKNSNAVLDDVLPKHDVRRSRNGNQKKTGRGKGSTSNRRARGKSGASTDSIAEDSNLMSVDDEAIPSEIPSEMWAISDDVASDEIEDEIGEDIMTDNGSFVDSGGIPSDEAIETESGGSEEGSIIDEIQSEISISDDMDGDNGVYTDDWGSNSISDHFSVEQSAIIDELDDIEEDLVERLAEVSSNMTSAAMSSVLDDSEVVDLVDRLPLSDSNVRSIATENDQNSAASSAAIDTEISENRAALENKINQRRTYAAVRANAEKGAVAFTTDANRKYLRDSPASSVFTDDSMDGDVEYVTAADYSSSSASATSTSEKPHPAALVRRTESSGGRDSSHSSVKAESDSASFNSAMEALETDVALTKRRRRAALVSLRVPEFSQLYDPQRSSPSSESSDTPTPLHQDPAQGLQPSKTTYGRPADEVSALLPLLAGEEVEPTATTTPALGQTNDADGDEAGAASTAPHADSRCDAEAQAGPEHPSVQQNTRLSHYYKDDLVAQSVWKERQLKLFRELQSPQLYASLRTDDEWAGEAAPKNSADIALDAAEERATREWAQHWGVLESLLLTRFGIEADPCAWGLELFGDSAAREHSGETSPMSEDALSAPPSHYATESDSFSAL